VSQGQHLHVVEVPALVDMVEVALDVGGKGLGGEQPAFRAFIQTINPDLRMDTA
jgi:hypothetical protein